MAITSDFDGRPDSYYGRDGQLHRFDCVDWDKETRKRFTVGGTTTPIKRKTAMETYMEQTTESILNHPLRVEKEQEIVEYILNLGKVYDHSSIEHDKSLENVLKNIYLSNYDLEDVLAILTGREEYDRQKRELAIKELLRYPAVCVSGNYDELIVKNKDARMIEWNTEKVQSLDMVKLLQVTAMANKFFNEFKKDYNLSLTL